MHPSDGYLTPPSRVIQSQVVELHLLTTVRDVLTCRHYQQAVSSTSLRVHIMLVINQLLFMLRHEALSHDAGFSMPGDFQPGPAR